MRRDKHSLPKLHFTVASKHGLNDPAGDLARVVLERRCPHGTFLLSTSTFGKNPVSKHTCSSARTHVHTHIHTYIHNQSGAGETHLRLKTMAPARVLVEVWVPLVDGADGGKVL